MKRNAINVCLAADENYAMQAGVSICSILENNKNDSFTFYLLADDYSEDTKARINKIECQYKTKVIIIDVTSKLRQLSNTELYVKDAIHKNGLITFMYARLFIASLLPETVDRVIYIDCDTIVRKSIKTLYDYDIHGVMGAVIDLYPVNYNKVIGFEDEDLYFNSGVLLIDLKKWREKDIENQILNYISTLTHTLYMHDQDILNIVLKGEIDTIPLEFNMMYITRAYSPSEVLWFTGKNETTYYSLEQQKEAKEKEVIVHYAGDYFGKPWDYPKSNKYAIEWNKIKCISPWGGVQPRRQPIKKKANQILHEMLYFFIKGYWLRRTRKRFIRETDMFYLEQRK